MPAKEDKADEWRSRSHPIKEDMRYQRAIWRVERIGWCILSLIVALALLGAFSNGPLSSTSAVSPSGKLHVEYDRFGRNGAMTAIAIRMEAAPGPDIPIRIGREFLNAFTIQSIKPTPRSESSEAGAIHMHFEASPGLPLTIRLSAQSDGLGFVTGEIGLLGEQPVRFTQFIYP